MDWFMLALYILGIFMLAAGITVIILYFRFIECRKRLPEACEYLDLKQKTEALRNETVSLEKARIELPILNEEVKVKREWLEKNEQKLLSLDADRKKQEELKAEYEGYLDKLSVLLQQLQDKNRESSALEAKHIFISEQIKEKTSKLDTLTASYADLQTQTARLAQEKKRLDADAERVQKKVQELEDEKEHLNDFVVELQRQHKLLDAQIQATEKTAEDHQFRIKKFQDEISALQSEKRQLDVDNTALMKESEVWRIENEAARRELQEVQEQIEEKQQTISNLEKQRQDLQKGNSALEIERESVKRSIDDFVNNSQRLQQEISELRTKQNELDAKNVTLLKENETWIAEKQRMIQEVHRTEATLTASEEKLTQIRNESIEGQRQVDQLVHQRELVLEKLNAVQKAFDDIQVELETAQNTRIELETQNFQLQTSLASLQEKNIFQQNKSDELQEQLQVQQQIIYNLEKNQQELQEENNTLAVENESAKRSYDDFIHRTERLQQEVASLRSEKNELDAKNAALMKENETWSIENETALRGLRELQDQLGAEADKLDNIRAEYALKHSEIEVFETRKKALEDEIEALKNTCEAISQATGKPAATDALKDLWEPITFPALLPSSKERSEMDLLEDTQSYIRGKKLYFPNRTLHAFHTSMKCNDISPLTVLAGISGTGKSELPKCYAEGMGIHFSMLAVQPRWDSPQDLLGFYNYMENKYKATELARAMVRFDMFNRPSWGEIPEECDDRSDRMLLVLLDEMNLARVEYYFSEFLSKLETRRGVNIQDPLDRVKAEIELELSGRAPLHIFPGRNILFTGTMNEDESTQSLSDKVLDRANVLRFGKPKSSDISAKVRNSVLRPPRQDGMTYSRWTSWCSDAKDITVDRTISEWIDELNEVMAELQKPFGHRVAQAIAAYVANYPRGAAHGKERKMAFADQIEQRIMPKLRGVDLILHEDALNKIGKLISRTNDEALANAFEQGCKDDANGVFMWQGVDRSEEI